MPAKTFYVPNITCDHCVMTIERELSELDGVNQVKANPQTRTVFVAWDEARTSADLVGRRLEAIHYPPAPGSQT